MFLFLGNGCTSKKVPLEDDTVQVSPTVSRSDLLKDPLFLAELKEFSKQPILVVAPSSGMEEEKIQEAYDLEKLLPVHLSKNALHPNLIPYNANADKVRADLMIKALNDQNAKVIWALKGGYGSSRILGKLAQISAPKKAKIFIGYSDLTFIHLFLQKWGWKTVHGAMLWEILNPSKDEQNFRILAELLSGRRKELIYDGLEPLNEAAKNLKAPIQATIIGGNLTCLAHTIGTPWTLDATGRILFLEDVKEQGYRLDRLLTHLHEAGLLKNVQAVLFGNFTEGDEYIEFALERFAHSFDKPVFRSVSFGHGQTNYPLVFNAPATIYKSPTKENFVLNINTKQIP